MKEQRKHRKKIILLIIMVILLIISYSSLHMGNGEICKTCYWANGEPITSAEVGLDENEDGIPDVTLYTGQDGGACFQDLPCGQYYIYVDMDNDGVWDTVAEPVIVNGVEYIDNVYPLPKMWRFEDENS